MAQAQVQKAYGSKSKPNKQMSPNSPKAHEISLAINRDFCHSFKGSLVEGRIKALKYWNSKELKIQTSKKALKTCKFLSSSRSTSFERMRLGRLNFPWIPEDRSSNWFATTTF